MKKLILSIAILILASPAFAAWSVLTVEFLGSFPAQTGGGTRVLYKVTGTSDASGSGDLTLSTGLNTFHGDAMGSAYHKQMQGGVLLAVEYVPDGTDTPTSAPQITIDTVSGTLIFDETVATAATGEPFAGDVDLDLVFPLTDLIFASGTLANTKKAVFYIWILN